MVIVDDHCTVRHRSVITVGDCMLWRDDRFLAVSRTGVVRVELGYDTTVTTVVASTHHRLPCKGISQPVAKQCTLHG